MSDYKTGQPVKTLRDDEFKNKIVDGQSGETATDILSIVGEGDTIVADSNDWGIPWMARDEDGDYVIPKTDSNGNLIVVPSDDDDDVRQHSYKDSGSLAESASDDHDLVVTSAKKVRELELVLSSSGCFKYEVGEFDGTATFDVRAVFFTSPASQSQCCKVCLPEITGDGSKAVRVRVTNMDADDNCAYSTVCFIERD